MDGLDAQVAVITGASSGIGAATAHRFVRCGAAVALVARGAEALEALAAELGAKAIALPADVTDPIQVAHAVDECERRLGAVTIAVNSAGVAAPAPLKEVDAAAWQQVIDVNLSGSFHVARETGLRMREGDGGAIVNVGSELSHIGMSWYVAYCASKAGILGLTRALAAELSPTVRVNAICPGPIDTPMLASEFEIFGDVDRVRQETVERVPLRSLGTAEQVADGIVFLANRTSYVTGSALALDGGTTIV